MVTSCTAKLAAAGQSRVSVPCCLTTARPLTPMPMRRLMPLLLPTVLAACPERPEADHTDTIPVAELEAPTSLRVMAQQIGQATLSDSARIERIFPEPDGDAIAFIVSDPAQPVEAALAIHDARMDTAQLLWPDSVTEAWWAGDHTLAFTAGTGRGAYLVVNVHAASLEAVESPDARPARSEPPADEREEELRAVAQRRIDSLHIHRGEVPGEALTYTVVQLLESPTDPLSAFYVISRDTSGTGFNPSWWVLDNETGAIGEVDSVTGPEEELPRRAAAWTREGRFLYAKGLGIYETRVTNR